jgi:hypothetical protein
MLKRSVFILLLILIAGGGVWTLLHFRAANYKPLQAAANESRSGNETAPSWYEAVEKVKEARPPSLNAVAIETPPELRHYSDRHWFLAAQIAEVEQHNVPTCRDFIELAGMIRRGEFVPVPSVTNTYVLYGVGAKADDTQFTRFINNTNLDLSNESEVADAYRKLDQKRSNLEREIALFTDQLNRLNKGDDAQRSELEDNLAADQQALNSVKEDKQSLDLYSSPEGKQKLLNEYESLQTLAKNFNGRSFKVDNPADRQAFRVNMLSTLRPQALKVLEQVASDYQHQFDRPLPVSSLIRPEQYQHALRRVNRNAVLIETPPHSTGLAFDIDYRYMSPAEQNFVMAELARLKNEGRIEVIRESNANYHVFVFIDGVRPNDDLIAASLEKALSPVQAHHASPPKLAKPEKKQHAKKGRPKAKAKRARR